MPTTTYAHFRDVPESSWRWPSFSPAEIACRGTGAIKINTEAMDKLQSLRNRLGKPLIVRSGYRSPSHNRAVGGAPASKHMLGTAFDIAMSNHDPVSFAEAARAVGFLGFGTYPRSGFMHIDLGPARSWGEPFAPRATPFVPEIPPAREVLADSRTLKGGGAAGIATVGAAGVEVAQDVLAETQSAILPLVSYFDTLRWVFIAVALIGIAVAIHARIPVEMGAFVTWFNAPLSTDPVIKAALAHLWFVTIHPFEDGNGRIARAIADLALARSEASPQRFYSMSAQIRIERSDYYDELERTQKGATDVTDWLTWFLACLGRAIHGADGVLAAVIAKAQFWERAAALALNERQIKILNRLLDGFEGKMTSSKWATIAKCSQDTANRDIAALLDLGLLLKGDAGGRSTSYEHTL